MRKSALWIAVLLTGGFALPGEAVTLQEVLKGLEAAKQKASAVQFIATESFEEYLGDRRKLRGDSTSGGNYGIKLPPATTDLGDVAISPRMWKSTIGPEANYRWARNGDGFYLGHKNVVLAFDGKRIRSRERTVLESGEETWLTHETPVVRNDLLSETSHFVVDPVAMGYRVEVVNRRGRSWPWLAQAVLARGVTVKAGPEGKVSVDLVQNEPTLTTNFSLSFNHIQFSLWPGTSQRLLLDPQRGYMIEQMSSVGDDVGNGETVATRYKVIRAEKVGQVWLPTQYVSFDAVLDGRSSPPMRITLSKIETSVPANLLSGEYRMGDIRVDGTFSADAVMYRFSSGGKWERQETKEEKAQDRVMAEYGMMVAPTLVLIGVVGALLGPLRRRNAVRKG